MRRFVLFLICALATVSALPDSTEDVRSAILSAYNRSIEALSRGDADTALSIDTPDWTSHTTGMKPRTKTEMEPFLRRDIATMKPPADWKAVWRPDYQRNGTVSGIQVYDVKVEGDRAVVLCLVGSAQGEHWRGSHVRDTWVRTASGWKRQKHEKLTINERMVNGKAPQQP